MNKFDMEAETPMDDENCSFSKTHGRKKTWQELRQDVRNVRRHLTNVSSKVPSCFSFKTIQSENGSPFCRIYFLSTVSSGRETTLLYCDVPLGDGGVEGTKDFGRSFLWQPLLESTFQTFQPQGRFSREEQLQFERKRVANWGLTSYDFQSSCGRFVFPACGSVFYCDDDGTKVPPFFPQELKSSTERARLNPQICPWNSNLIAYVYNCDLWVHHVSSSRKDVRLTYARRGTDLADDPISAGIPSYVTQEEFNRYTGYWWQPVALPRGSQIYRILYEEVDECEVEILRLPCYTEEKELEEYRFPRAGTSNAKSVLKIVQFSVNASNQIEQVMHFALNESFQTLCPNHEYLVRAGWTPDGRHVWAEVLDRQQSHEQLVLIPMSSFVPSCPSQSDCSTLNHCENSPVMQIIYEEKSDVWINVHDVLHFFEQESQNEMKFLWASEETGFRHLYIITVQLHMSNDSVDSYPSLNQHDWLMNNRIKSKVALTSGEWEVSEQDVWVNESKGVIFFMGLKDTPLEKHLYVVNMEKLEEPVRLTYLGYSNYIAMNEDFSLFVAIQSNVGVPPFGRVYQLQYSLSSPVKVSCIDLGFFLEQSSGTNTAYPHPELFSYRLDSGHTIYGMLFRPPNMCPGEKYPTVLTIYGGPEVQLVTNTFKGMRSLRQYLLASAGYVVVAIDCRGSRHRGLAFEGHVKGRMGTVEIADHVEVLLWMSQTMDFIDINRIAVHGWSYGGYLSLMGLAQRPDIFKVAVAGAPVTSWLLYDTGYTERYMNTPSKNVPGYSTGSVLSYVHKFPNEENRLLIIHGLMDENVHFRHTAQLINSLIKAGKPYQLQVYPTERHSLRHLDSSEHYETTLLSFLEQHL